MLEAIGKFIKGGGFQEKAPLDIARERFDRGEISAEEFDKIKKNPT
ncbi:SHOCT domain-containing protein [Dehalogenimonas sp. 4OHTPN]|uniref:SHOCT domain-containing protein n=1 Tax=Dehalogenimonas sp. 4OHTPN TaxID=3166643 RepID=A0AAU8GBI0_9CHLR